MFAYTVVAADDKITSITAANAVAAERAIRAELIAAADRLGLNHDGRPLTHGTRAVIYCRRTASRRCGGHLIARVFDDVRPNETTAASRAAAIALATASATDKKEAGNV